MPLPLGHGLMGYALYQTIPNGQLNWRIVAMFALVANLPDADFLPGFILGDPNRFHHHFVSHSLGTALFVGGMLGLWFSLQKGKKFLPHFLVWSIVCYSHVVLDLVTVDTSVPKGVPLLWPLSSEYFYSPFSIFMSVTKEGATSGEFLRSLFVTRNLWVALWEIAVLLPVLGLVIALKKRKKLGLKLASGFEV